MPAAPVVGASIKDYLPFCSPEIDELYRGVVELAQLGQPPEIPAAIPMGHLIRMGKTVQDYRVRSKAIIEALTADPVDQEKVKAALADLIMLVNQPVPTAKKSKLVTI